MQIHEITAAAGRLGPNRKRVGRGIGSHGKTAGRGHKGESSRSGSKGYLFKEGGQMPMFRKVAKRGFSAGDYSAQKKISIVNVGAFAKLGADVTVVNADVLIEAGLIPRRTRVVRVLGGGELSRALTVEADHVSRAAAEKIQGAGGKVVLR
jgi:large subunit ribosomal protein L15